MAPGYIDDFWLQHLDVPLKGTTLIEKKHMFLLMCEITQQKQQNNLFVSNLLTGNPVLNFKRIHWYLSSCSMDFCKLWFIWLHLSMLQYLDLFKMFKVIIFYGLYHSKSPSKQPFGKHLFPTTLSKSNHCFQQIHQKNHFHVPPLARFWTILIWDCPWNRDKSMPSVNWKVNARATEARCRWGPVRSVQVEQWPKPGLFAVDSGLYYPVP